MSKLETRMISQRFTAPTISLHLQIGLALLLLPGIQARAQWRNANWIFTHWLQFGSGSPNVLPAPSACGSTPASLSTPNGDLLMWVGNDGTGDVIRCADGSLMPVPSSFNGGNGSRSWLLLPWPGDTTKVAAVHRTQNPFLPPGNYCLQVGCVEMAANNGLGAILQPPVLILDTLTDKLTAVPHANGTDYWIISHRRASNAFVAHHLRSTGINTVPVVSNAGSVIPDTVGGIQNPMQFGPLVASEDGSLLACLSFSANPTIADTSITEVFELDGSSGLVSLLVALPSDFTYWGSGGIEFSPDGSKAYVAELPFSALPTISLRLWQFDLSVLDPNAILSSQTLITEQLMQSGIFIGSTSMAAAPDGKIHVGQGETAWLATIEQPDSLGIACDLELNGIPMLPTNGFMTMPNFCKRYHDSVLSVGTMDNRPIEQQMSIWPVPTLDVLSVNLPTQGHLAILDMLGREIRSTWFSASGDHTLTVHDLAPGPYFLCFSHTTETPTLCLKFLKE